MGLVRGGPQAAASKTVHPVPHGQLVGNCSICFRAEVKMRLKSVAVCGRCRRCVLGRVCVEVRNPGRLTS